VKIRILGSAAGGGFPQWNCGCPNCRGLREGSLRAYARTQESAAVSADRRAWFLLNASPEIRAQVEAFPPLWPRERRHSPISGILLGNGDLDHCLGLLSLRESHPLTLYATASVRRGFTEGNALYKTLERFPGQVTWVVLEPGIERPLAAPGGADSGLFVTAVPVPGKRPLHIEASPTAPPPSPGDNVGFRIRDGRGKSLAYFSAVAGLSEALADSLSEADCVCFDGTFWSEDELAAAGVAGTGGAAPKRARDMAHWPVGGPEGSLAWLAGLRGRGGSRPRRILTHINNTNPLLREDSPERAAAAAAGVEIAGDGLEIDL
jgi:pyrroloquinoline quinone biosynthesis protein B